MSRRTAAARDGRSQEGASAPPRRGPPQRGVALSNFAMQRVVQAKLRVSDADDPAEREADRIADSLGSHHCGGCNASAPCSSCATPVRRKASGSASRETWIDETLLRRLGSGAPLDHPLRSVLQQRLARDLTGVRVHTGAAAALAARSIQARAFTVGSDIVFDDGEYAPGTEQGRNLIAHEATHVAQQGDGAAPVRRRVNGDIRFISISPQWAENLTPFELVEQIRIVETQKNGSPPNSAEHLGAAANLDVLRAEFQKRTGVAAPGTLVPRPAGLPLDGAFRLGPLNLPPALAAQVPAGRMVSLDALSRGVSSAAGYVADRPSTALLGPGAGATGALGANLGTWGFAAAGPDAIGILSFPRYAPGRALAGLSTFLPEHPVVLGHTALYVRIGGKIHIVRSYATRSLLQGLMNFSGIKGGTMGVPAGIFADTGPFSMFNVSNARSLEWAIPRPQAAAFAESLPRGNWYGMGTQFGESLYTAAPAVKNACVGTNCIGWALPQVEQQLGIAAGAHGPVPIAEAARPGISVGQFGEAGAVTPNEFSQGRLMKFLASASDDISHVAPVTTATGEALPAAAGGLSRGMRVISVAGKAMFVIGALTVPAEIALARPEERARTAVGSTSGFVGGLAAGAGAGLLCGPGAPVCSVVAGIAGGIAGAFGARWGAEALYDWW